MRYSYDVKKEIKIQLRSYNAFKSKLHNINNRLEELNNFTGIQSVKLDQQCANSQRDKGSLYIRNISLKDKLIEERIELIYTIENIEAALSELKINVNDKLFKIIEMRYFDNISINKICDELYIDKSTYYRYEDKAFDVIKAYMPN